MSWALTQRQTRSGMIFSPFTSIPAGISVLVSQVFNFPAALVKAIALEHEAADKDHEHSNEEPDEDKTAPSATNDKDGHVPPLAAAPAPWNHAHSPAAAPRLAADDVDNYVPPLAAVPAPWNGTHNASPPPLPDRAPPPPPKCAPNEDHIAPSAADDVDNYVPPLTTTPNPWAMPDPWNTIDDASPHPTPDREPPCPPNAPAPPSTTCVKARSRRRRNRAAKRTHKTEQEGHTPCASTLRRYVHAPLATALRLAIDMLTLPTTHGAYAAKAKSAEENDPRPIVDAQGHIFAILMHQPRDPAWAADVLVAYRLITAEGMAASFPACMRKHRHGLFAVLNVGLFYGKGQMVPSALRLDPQYVGIAERLLRNPAIKRMAAFTSGACAMPHLDSADCLQHPSPCGPHAYINTMYWDYNEVPHARLPHLPHSFQCSMFSSVAFNFSPHVWTFCHRDILNLPFGWCTVQSAGEFHRTHSGHLVLWDLKLVMDFPHSTVILLPSATIAHSNIPVHANETRVLFTQYTTNGLM
ncbi:hypothetical protein B0H17DRAFT_1211895 [Mycena rosella]|uniref:Uncharacterized protein n=1 Tax=Mycena rosella TaxID=1033263 RepID=A0AAD7G797_MYCRO|nr:hypothetical protein B0H17DRAFT_1211895 [Mycena rosella]